MSKFIPDPQIQSLKAMRAGDISMPTPLTLTIGKVSAAVPNPTANESISATAVDSTVALAGTFPESPTIMVVDVTTVSLDANESFSLTAVETTVSVATTNENMTIGVATSTSTV